MLLRQEVKRKDITSPRHDFGWEASPENHLESWVLLMVVKMNWNILTDIISKSFFEERPCTMSETYLLAIHIAMHLYLKSFNWVMASNI